MKKTGLNKLAAEVNNNAVSKGFYEAQNEIREILSSHAPHLIIAMENAFFAQKIALIHSELSEALEAHRKNKHANYGIFNELQENLKYEGLSEDEAFEAAFEHLIKDTTEDELLADTTIRILDVAGYNEDDIDFHITNKMRYNSMQQKKHGKLY